MRTIYLRTVCLFLFVAMAASCSDDGEEIIVDTYLNPDVKTFSFDADGTRKLIIHVESAADWTVEYKAGWLTESDVTASSLTMGATANTEAQLRTATIVITNAHGAKASVVVNQGFRLSSSPPYFLAVFNTEIVTSPQGKYAAYIAFEYDEYGLPHYTPVVINMETGEVKTYETGTSQPTASCITDAGVFIIQAQVMDENMGWEVPKAAMYDVDGTLTLIDDGGYGNASVEGVTPDGKIMVGYIGQLDYIPCKWVNNELQLMDFPLEGIVGGQVWGALTRGCSLDGSVIYGSEWNTDFFSPVIWKGGSASYIGEETVEVVDYVSYSSSDWGTEIIEVSEYVYPTLSSQRQLSPNGRYLAGMFRGVDIFEETSRLGTWAYFPMLFDVETGTHLILEDIPGGSGTTVTDDGLFFYRDVTYTGYLYDPVSGDSKLVTDWMHDTYGIDVPENSMILSLSNDKKVIVGYQVSYIGGMPFEMYWVASFK